MIETKTVAPTVTMGSRRRTIRVAASHVKAFATAKMVPVVVEDLSTGGFAAVAPMAFDVGSVHVVRFTLGRIAVTLRAEVLNCRPVETDTEQRRSLVRFAFVGMSRPDGSTIDELLGAITTSTVSLDFF